MRRVAGTAWSWMQMGVVVAVAVPLVLLLGALVILFGVAFVQWVMEAPPVAWVVFLAVLSLPVIGALLDR